MAEIPQSLNFKAKETVSALISDPLLYGNTYSTIVNIYSCPVSYSVQYRLSVMELCKFHLTPFPFTEACASEAAYTQNCEYYAMTTCAHRKSVTYDIYNANVQW